jgi:hypothetical protein
MQNERRDHLTPEARTIWTCCGKDFTDLFGVVVVLRQEHGVLPPESERVRALCALRELLDLGLIEVRDDASSESVDMWPYDPAEAIDRLDRDWIGEPRMGWPPWFVATSTD